MSVVFDPLQGILKKNYNFEGYGCWLLSYEAGIAGKKPSSCRQTIAHQREVHQHTIIGIIGRSLKNYGRAVAALPLRIQK